MAHPKLTPPGYLGRKLSSDSAVARDIATLVEAVGEIATLNKTPFFPDYTDHGVHHLAAVLQWCVDLTPQSAVRKLTEEDAAVIVGGALLHDIGMHLHDWGFVELVGGSWPGPLPWFADEQEGRSADRPWPELWHDFKVEARYFDEAAIVRLLGADHGGMPSVIFEDGVNPAALTKPDRVYIGEFLRRHHARLAHEIAVFGFPALGDTFPSAPPSPKGLSDIRNLIGLVARSHNEDLRMVVDHLRQHEDADLAPAGVHVPYIAALLRIADFAQLGDERAPSILLRMTDPQSPVSVQAWKGHLAVTSVVLDDGSDPGAIRFRVSPDIELPTFLQLGRLFSDLQLELDRCSAVLAETYAHSSTKLAITKQRVRTNLASKAFLDALPFVPRDARLRSAEDMFRLVIHELYGDHPWVAGRELAQNACDAVRERRRARGDIPMLGDGWPDPQDDSIDVLIEVIVEAQDQVVLRIADRGIGMTPDVVVDYFLRTGASLGPTTRERSLINLGDAFRYSKAGRFGIGVLSSFLLCDELVVTTRHVDAELGLKFTAKLDSNLVRIDRQKSVSFGTCVTMRLTERAKRSLARNADNARWRDEPSLNSLGDVPAATALARWIRRSCTMAGTKVQVVKNGRPTVVLPGTQHPLRDLGGDSWITTPVPGFGSVAWRPVHGRSVVINGIRIIDPDRAGGSMDSEVLWDWDDPLVRAIVPLTEIDIEDRFARIPLNLTRTAPTVPGAVLTALLVSRGRDIVAMALERPGVRPLLHRPWGDLVTTHEGIVPLLPGLGARLGLTLVRFENWLQDTRRELSPPPPKEGRLVHWKLAGDPRITPDLRDASNDMRIFGMEPVRLELRAQDDGSHWPIRGIAKGMGLETRVLPEERDPDHGLYDLIGLSSDHPLTHPCSVLGDVWAEVAGAGVPYDSEARRDMADRIRASHPEMRPYLDRQARLAAEDAELSARRRGV